jgi:hypothetical protein
MLCLNPEPETASRRKALLKSDTAPVIIFCSGIVYVAGNTLAEIYVQAKEYLFFRGVSFCFTCSRKKCGVFC